MTSEGSDPNITLNCSHFSLELSKERLFSGGIKLSDWALDSALIETLCEACGILGLWHAPKNPQNVKVFFPASLSVPPPSLSLAPLPLFFSSVQGCLTSAQWVLVQATDGQRGNEQEQEGLGLWHPAVWLTGIIGNRLWTNGLKGKENISEVSHPFLFFTFSSSIILLCLCVGLQTVANISWSPMCGCRKVSPKISLVLLACLNSMYLLCGVAVFCCMAGQKRGRQSRARFKLALSVVLLLLLQIQLFLTEAIPCCLTLRWLLALNVIKPH